MENRWHRWFNTTMTSLVLGLVLASALYSYRYYNVLLEQERNMSEISQIVQDEGFRSCPYNDSEGKATVGFGHLILEGEKFTSCITPQEGIKLLVKDYYIAKSSVEAAYPWADGEVKLVLTNMTYQLGPLGVSKFKKSLDYLVQEEYMDASMELLDSKWHNQTESRSLRLAVRILALQE